jgi:hypothetical protein
VSTSVIPPLLERLVDDAAVFPPGNAAVAAAIAGHRRHRGAWYSVLVGRLLLPTSSLTEAASRLGPDELLEVGIVADVPLDRLDRHVNGVDPRLRVGQVEAPVARRGEDPQAGLDALLPLCARWESVDVYAEVPLTPGLLGALDRIAAHRDAGTRIAPKFRTGGLAAELFPTPMELAAIMCACHERGLAFKLTAGLHRALRHNDPETGFIHHGFLNVLAASVAAAGGAEVVEVCEVLAATDPLPVIEVIRPHRAGPRALWAGFGSCSIDEPLDDLRALGLIDAKVTAAGGGQLGTAAGGGQLGTAAGGGGAQRSTA